MNMLTKGLSIELIAEYLNISSEKVTEFLKQKEG